MLRQPTVLFVIPAPKTSWLYHWAWFPVYRLTRRLRHAVGRHDWRECGMGSECLHCDWCGERTSR